MLIQLNCCVWCQLKNKQTKMKSFPGIIMLLWNSLFCFERVTTKKSLQSVTGGRVINVGGPFKPRQLPTHRGFFPNCSNGSFNSSLPSPTAASFCRMSCTVHTHRHVRGHPPILLHTVAGSCPDIRGVGWVNRAGWWWWWKVSLEAAVMNFTQS